MDDDRVRDFETALWIGGEDVYRRSIDPECLTTIAGACRDRERLRFAYRSRDGTDSRRLVEPHSLVNLGRRWYLVAFDCERDDWRTFRVDRIAGGVRAAGRGQRREVPGGDAAAYVKRQIRPFPRILCNRY